MTLAVRDFRSRAWGSFPRWEPQTPTSVLVTAAGLPLWLL